MTTKLTPETLRAFIEKKFATKEHPTVPYVVDVAYQDQLEVTLGIKVAQFNDYQCVIDWVETFGKDYQFHLSQEMFNGELVITGFTFWLKDDTEWDWDLLSVRRSLLHLIKS
jgi:hypothetical protein